MQGMGREVALLAADSTSIIGEECLPIPIADIDNEVG